MTKHQIEVITSVERRRRWSQEDKERLVAACLEPGAVLSEIARAAGIHVSQLFRWRKELCQIEEPRTETASTLVPVVVSEAALPASPIPSGPLTPSQSRRKRSDVTIELGRDRRIVSDKLTPSGVGSVCRCISDRRFTNCELLCLRLALELETSI
ncbi:IS66-like element accessory protein TnpA [Rhizobium leguminosarum]|nr:transposase [Rhizobium leguminosarum]MBY2937182.1 transposase [Rhizobium leguminosarum]